MSVFSSMPEATTSGGAHSKQASSPGLSSWMWPETASSETPDSSHVCPSSLHAALMLIRACAWPVATSVGIGWPVREDGARMVWCVCWWARVGKGRCRAWKLSTQLSTMSIRPPPMPPFSIMPMKCSKLSTVVCHPPQGTGEQRVSLARQAVGCAARCHN